MKAYSILTMMTTALFAFCALVMPALPARADWVEGTPQWWWKYVYPGGYPPHWASIVRFTVEGPHILPSGTPGYEVTFAMQNQSDTDYNGGDSWMIKGFCDPNDPQPWRPVVLGEGRLPAIGRGKVIFLRTAIPQRSFQAEAPRLLMLTLNNAPDTVRMTGRINLQGSMDMAQKVQLKFMLGDGSVAYTTETLLDSEGRLLLPYVPSGFPKIAIKGDKWLQKVIENDDVKTLEALLPAGDANGDNFCDMLDLHRLIRSFDMARGDEGYDIGADLNCNGLIDVEDLDLLIRNFDSMGDV